MAYIRESAEQTLRILAGSGSAVQIKSAVISVPAYFQQAQTSETIEAAKNAGFTEIDLIEEPIAGKIINFHQTLSLILLLPKIQYLLIINSQSQLAI